MLQCHSISWSPPPLHLKRLKSIETFISISTFLEKRTRRFWFFSWKYFVAFPVCYALNPEHVPGPWCLLTETRIPVKYLRIMCTLAKFTMKKLNIGAKNYHVGGIQCPCVTRTVSFFKNWVKKRTVLPNTRKDKMKEWNTIQLLSTTVVICSGRYSANIIHPIYIHKLSNTQLASSLIVEMSS